MAEVALIYLPSGDGRTKQGVDDYLASGYTVEELQALATTELREPPQEDQGELHVPYRATSNGLIWDKATQNGTVPTPLTNFTARIVADVAEDDGAEIRRSFELEATLGGRETCFGVPAAKFNSMGWATEHMGAGAIVYPGFSIKDHARAAIQMLSCEIVQRRVFTHTGWRKVDGVWLYMHGGGAVGSTEATEGFEVALNETLSLYTLPEPPESEDLKKAIRASLGIWEVAPDGLMIPLHSAIYRAVMGESDFSLHLSGPTGEGKSEIAALCQQHFGGGLDARHLTSWESTDNALESKAFALKDSLMVIDDFAPTGTSYDVQRFHKKADRIGRGKGNAAGRERLRADTTARPSKPPRALIFSTGEDIPRGHSLRARMLILELGPGDVYWQKLTECQKDAREGLYAGAMAGYVAWLGRDYEEIRKRLPEERQTLREEVSHASQHKRTPGIVADLGLGLKYFLNFAGDAGAISRDEAKELWERGWRALSGAAASQASYQAASEPTLRFLELLSAAITSGRAHVAGIDGSMPEENVRALGWRKRTVGTGEFEREEWQPQGDKVGWVKDEDLYLEPEASYRVAQSQAQGGESITVAARTLRKRLKEKGLLVSTDERRQTLTVRRTIEGVKDRSVLHLDRRSLFSSCIEPDEPDAAGQEPHENGDSSCLLSSGSGTDRQVIPLVPDDEKQLNYGENSGDRRVRQVFEEDSGSLDIEGMQAHLSEPSADPDGYELVNTQDQVNALVEQLEGSDIVAIDLETTGLNPRVDRARLISLATQSGAWLVDCFNVDPSILFPVLAKKTLVMHNAVFDLGFLLDMGFEFAEGGGTIDTMLMSKILENKDLEESREAA